MMHICLTKDVLEEDTRKPVMEKPVHAEIFFSFQAYASKHESLFFLKVTMHFLMVHVESCAFHFILLPVFSFYFECQHFGTIFIPELC